MEHEMWKDIIGFPDYSISNTGLVKSKARQLPMPMGGFRDCHERILKARAGSHGYLYVNLCSGDGKKSACIHRLVAEAYLPNLENKKCVNHKDGNKLNNGLSNLEWASHSENNKHAYDTGLKIGAGTGKLGAKNPSSKKVAQYSMDGQYIKTFSAQREASRETGILQGNISAACHGIQQSAGGYIWKLI